MAGSPIQLKGAREFKSQLAALTKTGAKRVLRKATRAGTTVLAKAIKAGVPVDEGQLKRAQGSKVSGRGFSMRGVVGADVAKLQADNAENSDRPTNIDHLVNFGHVTPGGKFVPPSGYMQRGAAAGMPAAEARYVAAMGEGIAAEALRK